MVEWVTCNNKEKPKKGVYFGPEEVGHVLYSAGTFSLNITVRGY